MRLHSGARAPWLDDIHFSGEEGGRSSVLLKLGPSTCPWHRPHLRLAHRECGRRWQAAPSGGISIPAVCWSEAGQGRDTPLQPSVYSAPPWDGIHQTAATGSRCHSRPPRRTNIISIQNGAGDALLHPQSAHLVAPGAGWPPRDRPWPQSRTLTAGDQCLKSEQWGLSLLQTQFLLVKLLHLFFHAISLWLIKVLHECAIHEWIITYVPIFYNMYIILEYNKK